MRDAGTGTGTARALRGAQRALMDDTAALRKQLVRLARVDELSLSELIGFRMIMDGAAIQLAAPHAIEQGSAFDEVIARGARARS